MMSLLVNTRLQATRLKTGHSPGLAEHHQGPNVSCPHQETAALAISFKKNETIDNCVLEKKTI